MTTINVVTNNPQASMLVFSCVFNDENELAQINFGDITENQRKYIYSQLLKIIQRHTEGTEVFAPESLDCIDQLTGGKLTVKKEYRVPDFDEFWIKYGYKVGKEEAIRNYKKLSDADKIIAVANIKHYDNYLERSKHAKRYPSVYLSKSFFKTEFKSLLK